MHACIGDRDPESRSFSEQTEKQPDGTEAGAEEAAEKKRDDKDNNKENYAEPKRRRNGAAEERIWVKKTENQGQSENHRANKKTENKSARDRKDLFPALFGKERYKTQKRTQRAHEGTEKAAE
jgi:hypothetical protein